MVTDVYKRQAIRRQTDCSRRAENNGDRLSAPADSSPERFSGFCKRSSFKRLFKQKRKASLLFKNRKRYCSCQYGKTGYYPAGWPVLQRIVRRTAAELSLIHILPIEQDQTDGKDPFDCIRTSVKNICDMGFEKYL